MSVSQKHPHDHDHEHDHAHDHDHSHAPPPKDWWRKLLAALHLDGHSHSHTGNRAYLDNEEGIRVVWLALAALTITSIIQMVIVLWSGSVALLADTIHNIGDGLNSVPLLVAFYLARRAATRRYTYGFGKAEDVAGIFIVLSIAFSAGVIFWESFQKLLNPQPLTNLGWLAAAAIIGFLGNETVALLQIQTGRRIGSAALVADGLHARTDGLTSLAVLVAAGGSWLGFPILDPIVGILIGITILFITRDAAKTMWYRLMDAIEPDILDKAEEVVKSQPGVKTLCALQVRWIGHRLQAEVTVEVDPALTVVEGHAIAEEVRHALFHEITNFSEIIVHVDPWSPEPGLYHQGTAHHAPVSQWPSLPNKQPH